ncbi:MAG: hypothetical protein ACXVRJ_03345 [Gaiellaceae bacterium]
MTASAPQPKAVQAERRIIERPRLIKLLDETDARTILLLAPAGYGKTTLARQWAKTLNGAVWVTLTPAHRDVAVIATELARAVDPDSQAAHAFVATYVKAHSNPQRMAREIAHVVADQLKGSRVQWVVLDDYHEIASQREAQAFVQVLNSALDARFLIASRLRPEWATARLAVYGDIFEVDRAHLALNVEESRRILGRHPELEYVLAQADGWPAVIGLAANARVVRLPGADLKSSLLHSYFAEELFKSASARLQRRLMQLALAPDLKFDELEELFGGGTRAFLDDGKDLGFINVTQEGFGLHPLVRDFLLEKLAAAPEADAMVGNSIDACVARGRWEKAFELILRFDRGDLVEPVLEAAYTPLIRSGRVATLATFAARIRAAPSFPPAVIDLAEADAALADGAFDLASRISQRAAARLPDAHHLLPRANTIIAESAYARARLAEAEAAYRAAFETAQSK